MDRKGLIRTVFGLLLLIGTASNLYAPPGGGCTPRPDFMCGMACNYSGWCYTPSLPTTMCMEIPGGCGSMENTECCPPSP